MRIIAGVPGGTPEDLLTLFPRQSTISVLYNPDAPEAISQGETLRVLHFTEDFWNQEDRRRNKYLCFVFLPVPMSVAFYRSVRNRRGNLSHSH